MYLLLRANKFGLYLSFRLLSALKFDQAYQSLQIPSVSAKTPPWLYWYNWCVTVVDCRNSKFLAYQVSTRTQSHECGMITTIQLNASRLKTESSDWILVIFYFHFLRSVVTFKNFTSRWFVLIQIQPGNIAHLTEAEWARLGVVSIGDRVRIRQSCRQSDSRMLNFCL